MLSSGSPSNRRSRSSQRPPVRSIGSGISVRGCFRGVVRELATAAPIPPAVAVDDEDDRRLMPGTAFLLAGVETDAEVLDVRAHAPEDAALRGTATGAALTVDEEDRRMSMASDGGSQTKERPSTRATSQPAVDRSLRKIDSEHTCKRLWQRVSFIWDPDRRGSAGLAKKEHTTQRQGSRPLEKRRVAAG